MPHSFMGIEPQRAVLSGFFPDEDLMELFGFKSPEEIKAMRQRARPSARPDATRVQQTNRLHKAPPRRRKEGDAVEPHPPAERA